MRNNLLIQDIFCAPEPKITNLKSTLEKAQKKYGKITTFFGSYKNPIGIEIEIEQAQFIENNIYWNTKNDGSLKIGGVEYVSIPLLGRNIDYALFEIKPILENKTNLWSHRTSIHVHQNVNNLSLKQLKTLIALYAAFEDVFFSFVDPVRRGNNYCYHLTDVVPENIKIGGGENQKYCALNFGNSLRKYGTVEYRHMNGTGDIKTIRRWIQLIVKLYRYVEMNNPEVISNRIKALSYTSQYREFLDDVFGATANLFDNLDLKQVMDRCVVWSKMYLVFGGKV